MLNKRGNDILTEVRMTGRKVRSPVINVYQKKKYLSGRIRSVKKVLSEKWKEAISSVVPIVGLVSLLCFLKIPLPSDALAGFALGAGLLIIGMGMFNQGAEMAMTPIGEAVGASLTRSRKLWIVLLGGFLVGLLVTMAEPDLTVLATQVPAIPNPVLIGAVALGTGIFLMLALLRILMGIPLKLLLICSYALVFLLSFLVPQSFMAVAFDSGGVTTGPMTVPFILALGAGVASMRADKGAENDSFGLVALSSVGPILSVMILSIVFQAGEGESTPITLAKAETSVLLFRNFWSALPFYLKEVGMALLPVIAFFLTFQFTVLHLKGEKLHRILWGLGYTYFGLTLFLTGVNVGFMPVGHFLGQSLAGSARRWALIPIGMIMGWFVVSAEPAVAVLNQQVYEMTAGAVPKKALSLSLSIGVSLSVGLSLWRVLAGIPILQLLIPGYALAFLLMTVSPPVFTAIAFDSGGVASGPMTATFLLPLAIGASEATGGNIVSDAFGVVALVAMTPLLAIQILGIVFRIRNRKVRESIVPAYEEIIELM